MNKPVDYIALRSFDNYIEAHLAMQLLENAYIACHLKDEHIVTIDPLLSPAIGGIKLMVHSEQAARAWSVLEERDKARLRSARCPICKHKTLTRVAETKNYSCRLAALASVVLNGQPSTRKYYYLCSHCGYDFKNLPEE